MNAGADDVEWRVAPGLTDYDEAVRVMEDRAAAIAEGRARELIWLVEHPPLYTAGTSADPTELIDGRFPVHASGRGGRYTYHGPGQRVVYLMLDLGARGRDVRGFVHALEDWVIETLADIGVAGRAIDGRVGIWTDLPDGTEAKVGAIGVRVRRWVTMHGLSVNVSPDLSHFGGIVPCGLPDFPVTSLKAMGKAASLTEFDAWLQMRSEAFLARLPRKKNS